MRGDLEAGFRAFVDNYKKCAPVPPSCCCFRLFNIAPLLADLRAAWCQELDSADRWSQMQPAKLRACVMRHRVYMQVRWLRSRRSWKPARTGN